MSNTIEDILLDAHHHNKREELLAYLETIRIKNPNRELTDLYQMAYERVMRPWFLALGSKKPTRGSTQ